MLSHAQDTSFGRLIAFYDTFALPNPHFYAYQHALPRISMHTSTPPNFQRSNRTFNNYIERTKELMPSYTQNTSFGHPLAKL